MSVLPFVKIPGPDSRTSTVDVDIAVPVYNEAAQLVASVTQLDGFLDRWFPCSARITIVDNASTDDTWAIAQALERSFPRITALHLDDKGRGRALRAAWSRSTAEVVAYMDVDLATDLHALLPLVAPLLSGHSDVAIGSRLAPGAQVVRGAKRELISRAYNLLLRTALRSRCSDAQCGFKAVRRDVAAELLPRVEDQEWFFDTELLVRAQQAGLRIHEVPVDWVDDLDSRVDILATALADLRGVWRLLGSRPEPGIPSRRERTPGSEALLRRAGLGAAAVVGATITFLVLRPLIGSEVAALLAGALTALGVAAVHPGQAPPTAARRWSRRLLVVGMAAGSGLATALALVPVRSAGLTGWIPEAATVALATLAAAVARFALLRSVVFRPAFGTHVPAAGPVPPADPGAATERPTPDHVPEASPS